MASLLATSLLDLPEEINLTFFHCEDDVISPPFYGLKKFASRQINAGLARIGGSTLVFDFGVAEKFLELTKDADVLHIHNLHGYYLDWPKVLLAWKNRPVVWTWHDQWGATGRCGFSIDCNMWLSGCKKCPHLDYYPAAYLDNAAREYRVKTDIYNVMSRMTVVSPSSWLGNLALQRGIPANSVAVVPNPVDLNLYDLKDKLECRRQLGIAAEVFIPLFVAADCSDSRKGYRDFAKITEDMNVHALAVGKLPQQSAAHIEHAGEVRDQRRLSIFYGAADVLVLPSKADNYPNTVIESIVSGTPVIAYDIGGVGSQLDGSHCQLIPYGDIEAMKKSLEDSKSSGGKSPQIQSTLHSYAVKKWLPRKIAEQYYELYQSTVLKELAS
jgi:glycosyltransferase involved in cell wall biosynthesis